MKTVAYLRVSTDEQREKQTISMQRRGIEEFCRREKIKLDKIYPDEGVSGADPLEFRPRGSELMADVRAGNIGKMIVWKGDRLSRNLRGFLNAVAEIEAHGVQMISLTEPFANGQSGKLMRNMLAVFAEHERETIISRTVSSSRQLAKDGVWMGGVVPYGYRKEGKDRTARLGPSIEKIPGCELSEFEVIRRIFRAAANGQSCVRIADELNRLGVPTRYRISGGKSSGRWRGSRIRSIIVNTTYYGIHIYGKRRNVRDDSSAGFKSRRHLSVTGDDSRITRTCPAIVPETLWQAANAALKRNQIQEMAHAKHDYLLRGLIKCSCCKLRYSGFGDFYRRRPDKERSCQAPGLRRRDLENVVWSEIHHFLRAPGLTLRQLEKQIGTGDEAVRRAQRDIEERRAARVRKTAARSRLVDLFTEGVIPREEFDTKARRIDGDIKGLEDEIAALQKRASDRQAAARTLGEVGSLLERLRHKLRNELTFADRRRIVELLVSEIAVERAADGAPKLTVHYSFDPQMTRLNQSRGYGFYSWLTPSDMGTRAVRNCTEYDDRAPQAAGMVLSTIPRAERRIGAVIRSAPAQHPSQG